MGNNINQYNEEEKRLKDSYYELMNKTLKERYDKNRNDNFNQNYSLFSKDFQKSYINQRIIMTKTVHFIPWKSYLMRGLDNFLSKDNECLWVRPLLDYISNESFPDQNKYQNLFFYQEIQILSMPKLKNNEMESERVPNSIKGKDMSEKIDDLFNDKDKNDENSIFENIKLKISSNLMGSFISADSDSPNSSMRRDPNYEYQYNKNKIKEYMEVFKQHISLKEHPIHLIIDKFIKEFIPYINDAIELYKNNNNNILNEKESQIKTKKVIKYLQDFIVLIQNVIKLFYSRSITYSYFKDEKDEFLNLVSYIIFNSDKIYQKFFELFELMNMEKIKLLTDKFELFGDIQPQEMGIKDKFCLNEKTEQFMEKLKSEKKNTKIYNKSFKNNSENTLAFHINGEEKLLDIKDDDDLTLSNKNNTEIDLNGLIKDGESKTSKQDSLKVTSDSGKLNLLTKNFSLLSEEKDYSKRPYGQAIEFLKRIADFKVPLEKLVIIASVSSLITECVNKYWKKMERLIQPSMLSIDADELMTIFMYIIYKSHMPLLFVHADFINYFTSPTTKSTMIGYYYTTLQGCLDFLIEIKDKIEFTKESI